MENSLPDLYREGSSIVARVHCDMTVDFITGFPDKRHTVPHSHTRSTAPIPWHLGPTCKVIVKCIFKTFMILHEVSSFYFCLPQKLKKIKIESGTTIFEFAVFAVAKTIS